MAKTGIQAAAFGYSSELFQCMTAIDKNPDRAPVGPVMLKWDPPHNPQQIPQQIAAMTPACGVELAATAKEIDKGRFTNATVSPAFQFLTKWYMKLGLFIS